MLGLLASLPEAGALPGVENAGGSELRNAERQQPWWAFQPVQPVAVAPVKEPTWSCSPIDQLVLAELETRELTPAPAAGKETLIRRATLDLTGLPPVPEEVDDFVRDASPDAFSRAVDRLLASPAHGERWARHWLDVVRYADYHDADPKARTASCEPLNAWRYRDWVVASLNRDLPFDEQILHQVAGDLLAAPDGQAPYVDGLVASTFLSNGVWDRGDADKEKIVSDMVDDQIDTVGKAFLGLTLGCARCHDHKFDPISQTDYYGLAGVFYSTHVLDALGAKGAEYVLHRVPLVPAAYVARREEQLGELDKVKAELAMLDKRSPPHPPDDPERARLAARSGELEAALLPEPPMVECAQEGGTPGGLFPNCQDVPVHIRGSYARLGQVVPRRLPEFLAGKSQPPIESGSGRLELARWIASPGNPLTARVLVNRLWQWHFGAGLVRTPNNFGRMSEPPSHPGLIDWLAARLVEDGWSLKRLHRRMLLSATYQQSSRVPEDALARDPENRWLGRFQARRLEAEAIRDTLLFAADGLSATLGGPASADLSIPRRSLYVQTARWDRSSYALLFDAANPDASVERRGVSTVAPQALFLLNHEFVLARARQLAQRCIREAPANETDRIQRAYRLLFARRASREELEICRQLVRGCSTTGADADAAWSELAHVLLCSNELVCLD